MIAIRIAEPSDLSRIMTFDPFPGDRIVEIVERRMLVAETKDLVVAYVAWQHGGCIVNDYVNKLVVSEEYRRRGIALKLVDALSSVLDGRVFISTGAGNTAAVALLERTGWQASGQIVGLLAIDEPELFYRRDL